MKAPDPGAKADGLAILALASIASAILPGCHESEPRSGDGDQDDVVADDPPADPAADETIGDDTDAGPDVDCEVRQCFDCWCDCGPSCGGCFSLCEEVPIEVLTCSCCSECPDPTDAIVDPSDVMPDTPADPPPDVPADWPTEVPADWIPDTSPVCAAAGGFCSGARWELCPAGYEPIATDPHRDCDMEGWCCVVAPWSPCSASGEANCVAGAACTGCWDEAPGGLACEPGRVCCVDMCW